MRHKLYICCIHARKGDELGELDVRTFTIRWHKEMEKWLRPHPIIKNHLTSPLPNRKGKSNLYPSCGEVINTNASTNESAMNESVEVVTYTFIAKTQRGKTQYQRKNTLILQVLPPGTFWFSSLTLVHSCWDTRQPLPMYIEDTKKWMRNTFTPVNLHAAHTYFKVKAIKLFFSVF